MCVWQDQKMSTLIKEESSTPLKKQQIPKRLIFKVEQDKKVFYSE